METETGKSNKWGSAGNVVYILTQKSREKYWKQIFLNTERKVL